MNDQATIEMLRDVNGLLLSQLRSLTIICECLPNDPATVSHLKDSAADARRLIRLIDNGEL